MRAGSCGGSLSLHVAWRPVPAGRSTCLSRWPTQPPRPSLRRWSPWTAGPAVHRERRCACMSVGVGCQWWMFVCSVCGVRVVSLLGVINIIGYLYSRGVLKNCFGWANEGSSDPQPLHIIACEPLASWVARRRRATSSHPVDMSVGAWTGSGRCVSCFSG